jgi:hypothetical protein
MKRTKIFHGMLLGSALLLAVDAFAADKGEMHVSSPETVGGARLAAGDYTVRWEDAGPIVQLRIMRGTKVVAEVPARLVALESVSLSNSVTVDSDGHGNRTVSQISFSGKRISLEIERPSTTATATIHSGH